jgi:DNA-binding SARP family transcriptional activator
MIPPCELPQHDGSMAAARNALGEAAFEAAWLEGMRSRDLAALVAETGKRTRAPSIVKDKEKTPAGDGPAGRGALRVRAPGAATVEVDGVAMTTADWGYAKPRELLFLLITSPPLSRGQVGAALWPDLSRQQLGNALHTALRELRRALGDSAWVVYSGGRYSINRSRTADCDVDTFEAALLASGRLHAVAGRHQMAAAAFRRVIEHEPLNETAHRELMTSWSALGEMARAARHYEELTVLLRSTVGVAPSPQTTEVYERLTTRP